MTLLHSILLALFVPVVIADCNLCGHHENQILNPAGILTVGEVQHTCEHWQASGDLCKQQRQVLDIAAKVCQCADSQGNLLPSSRLAAQRKVQEDLDEYDGYDEDENDEDEYDEDEDEDDEYEGDEYDDYDEYEDGEEDDVETADDSEITNSLSPVSSGGSKKHGARNFFLIVLIGALAGVVGFFAYRRYRSRKEKSLEGDSEGSNIQPPALT